MRFLKHLAIFGLFALAPACSGGASALKGGNSKKKPVAAAEKQPDTGSAIAPDEKIDGASEPAMVAGAFLTCGPADDAAELPANEGTAFGCVYRAGGSRAKLKQAVSEPSATVALDTGAPFAPKMRAAPASSPWHFHFGLPDQIAAHALKMTIAARIGGTLATKATTNLAAAPDAGADAGFDVPEHTGPSYLFVTSTLFRPGTTLTGASSADAACDNAGVATKLGIVGWKALIFSSSAPRYDLFFLDLGIRNLQNGMLAVNAGDFWKSPAPHGPIFDENGNDPLASDSTDPLVWTGFSPDGLDATKSGTVAVTDTCIDWNPGATGGSESTMGIVGRLNPGPDEDWLGYAFGRCNESHRLYCISP